MQMRRSTQRERLAILASGGGTNAARFMAYFREHDQVSVAWVVSNNASAPVLARAARAGVPSGILPGPAWDDEPAVLKLFEEHRITAIVLAGYMRLLPPYLIRQYPGRIVNIHPALLPRFGGKGMYGMHVHRAVIASGAGRSGITIHLVNERYDEGPVIFQKPIEVRPGDSPESLAARIQALEHQYYPPVVESYLLGKPLPE